MRDSNIVFSVTDLFFRNLNSKKKYVLNIGGARSGKSYAIMEVLFYFFLSQKNKKILITRKTRPALKISNWEVFLSFLKRSGYINYFEINKSDLTISYPAFENTIYFRSIDDPEKIKSTEFNYIFLEEANEFDYDDWIILKTRISATTREGEQNKIFLAMNPVECWVVEHLLSDPDVEIIRSNYKNNPFLSEDYIRSLEALKNEDERFYKIFALGEFAKLPNLVFENWEVIHEWPENEESIYGIDFGYVNPTVIIEVVIRDNVLFVRELLYKSYLTNSELIEEMKKVVRNTNSFIFADASEPARIYEIKRAGFNIHPANKDVKAGIDLLKRFRIKIFNSPNLVKEIKTYSYKVKDEKIIEEPIKFNDHAIDAMRYAVYTYFSLSEKKFFWYF